MIDVRIEAQCLELSGHRFEPAIAIRINPAAIDIGAAEQSGFFRHQGVIHESLGGGIVRSVQPPDFDDLRLVERTRMIVVKQRIGNEAVDRGPGLSQQCEFGIDRGLIRAELSPRGNPGPLHIKRGIMTDAQRHSTTRDKIGDAMPMHRKFPATDRIRQRHRNRVDPMAPDQLGLQRLPDRRDKLGPGDVFRPAAF